MAGREDAGGFRWELLWDGEGRTRARPAARASTSGPTSTPPTATSRPCPAPAGTGSPPDATGFANLAVAGDWTACGFDAGCVEAATRSGVLAARAILSGAVAAPEAGGRVA